jgi:hypothetical protein
MRIPNWLLAGIPVAAVEVCCADMWTPTMKPQWRLTEKRGYSQLGCLFRHPP